MAGLAERRGSLSERTRMMAHEVLSGRRIAALRSYLAFRRSGGHRVDRLHGPRKLRDQHPGRGKIRPCPVVGGLAREPDRDGVPGALRQTPIVTTGNLPELLDKHFPRPVVWAIGVIAEIAAMRPISPEFHCPAPPGSPYGLACAAGRDADHRCYRLRHLDISSGCASGPVELIIGYLNEMFVGSIGVRIHLSDAARIGRGRGFAAGSRHHRRPLFLARHRATGEIVKYGLTPAALLSQMI
jgi:hypothetical protein